MKIDDMLAVLRDVSHLIGKATYAPAKDQRDEAQNQLREIYAELEASLQVAEASPLARLGRSVEIASLRAAVTTLKGELGLMARPERIDPLT